MAFRPFSLPNVAGLHYAVRIFLGTLIVWVAFRIVGGYEGVWSVVSLIVVTEPHMKMAWQAFLSRSVNTFIGCGVGLAFLLLAGPEHWLLPPAVAVTVLLCTSVRVPLSWRIAPVTTALVLASGFAGHSTAAGLQLALRRTAEVLLGSAVALLVTWVMARVWPPPELPGNADDTKKEADQAVGANPEHTTGSIP